jgi:leucine dehydrogenase
MVVLPKIEAHEMAVWRSNEFDDHEQICQFADAQTGLRAIVAIHSTARGAAAGGTRFKAYEDEQAAVDDALRLSRAMSYKSALAGLPIGGGKAVIIGDPSALKTEALLHAYGRFLNRIGEVFCTGEDVGMGISDIEVVRTASPFVAGTSRGAGDPSIHTATGVMHGLRAVLKRAFGREDFKGVHVAIQGLGAVGFDLAGRLHAAGARLSVADIRHDQVERAAARFGAEAMPVSAIHAAEADIFSPCALGGVITEETAPQVRARAVAGAANTPLATPRAGELLAARGVLYAPDYVINAGGVMSGLEEFFAMPGRKGSDPRSLDERLASIHDRLLEIFDRAEAEGATPEATAERMARELIGR